MSKNFANHGFTIVELSVALIIISLISAMVLAGSLLIESSKLNKVIADITAINKSYQTFDLTYDAVPGDFKRAYSVWGANCAASAGNCNGNGDGKIQSYYAGVSSSMNDDEVRKTWRHLELAGLGGFSVYGASFPAVWDSTYAVGSSIPPSPMKGGGYIMLYGKNQLRTLNEAEPVGGVFSQSNNNVIYLGRPSDGHLVADGALNTVQALNIDNKLDDGDFATSGGSNSGAFRAFDGISQIAPALCTSGATYNLAYKKDAPCVVGFEMR